MRRRLSTDFNLQILFRPSQTTTAVERASLAKPALKDTVDSEACARKRALTPEYAVERSSQCSAMDAGVWDRGTTAARRGAVDKALCI